MYARLSFTITRPAGPPLVPADALIFRGGKVYLAVVRDRRIRLVEASLGYDDGRLVEVTAGITADDFIAMNISQPTNCVASPFSVMFSPITSCGIRA